jgi:hypothetical protein
MTDPTESPESLALDEIRKRHHACNCGPSNITHCGGEHWANGSRWLWPCDTAVVLAAYDDRAHAFTALRSRVTREDSELLARLAEGPL